MEFTYCKLIDVLSDIHSGGTPSTEVSNYWGGTLKWLSSGETSQRFISDTIDRITEDGVKYSSTKLAKKNNVVMACAGQGKTRGQTSFLLDDMYINQSVIALEANKAIHPLYLFYNLSLRYDELRGGSDASSTRGSITTTALKNLPFKYPDLTTQKRIVDILYTYDNLIENNNRRIALLEKAAQELYKEWFVRFRFPNHENIEFENGIPKGWEIKRIGDLAKVGAGGDAPQDYSPVRTYEYPIPIFSNGIANDGLYGFTKKATKQAESITISARGTVGFTCLRFEPYLPIVRLLSIEPDSKLIDVYYLYHNLRNDIIDGYGTSQQQITIPYFKKKKVIVPPIQLQNQYSLLAKNIYAHINILKDANIILIKQRDLLLPRLMSGKLEV